MHKHHRSLGLAPAPTGSRNVVRGSAEDQCRGLTGTGGGGGGGGSTVDIYLTPGTHHVNGRTWRTTCEPYSTTRRCRTEIKATTVSYTSGRFAGANAQALTGDHDLALARVAQVEPPRRLAVLAGVFPMGLPADAESMPAGAAAHLALLLTGLGGALLILRALRASGRS